MPGSEKHKNPMTGSGKEQKAVQQRLKGLFVFVIAVALLLSVSFFAVRADHDCHGDDCAICRQLSTCGQLLKALCAPACTAAAFAPSLAAGLSLLPRSLYLCATTPVSLKVRLLN